MTELNPRTKQLGLEMMVARCALLITEKHPRTDELQRVVAMVLRPSWSNIEPNTWSLPGGRIEDVDSSGMRLDDDTSVNDKQLQAITSHTVVRKMEDELGIKLRHEQLTFVDVFPNGPWATALFFALRERRPGITMRQKGSRLNELDGQRWANVDALAAVGAIFADHGKLMEKVLQIVTAKK